MSAPRIAVVDYGIGNLRSAEKALQHLGADARLTSDVRAIQAAGAVVLPGVGAFGACMQALRAGGPGSAPRSRLPPTEGRSSASASACRCCSTAATRPPTSPGLGVVRGRVTRLPPTVRLPQMGWNTLDISAGSRLGAHLPDPAWLYFVHSYAPEPEPDGVVSAWCDYGRRFAAAVEDGPLWATQFHPEKSGDVGMRMLRNFVEAVG